MRLKIESETRERRYGRVRLERFARVRLLRHALPISFLILRKKPTVLQSKTKLKPEIFSQGELLVNLRYNCPVRRARQTCT